MPNNINNINDKLYNGINHNNLEINNNLYCNLTTRLNNEINKIIILNLFNYGAEEEISNYMNNIKKKWN